MNSNADQRIRNQTIIRNIGARRLNFGPYLVPEVKIGNELWCKVHGLQTVAGWHGPKQWPKAKSRGGRQRLIVCGDLLRALEEETCDTVALHWGVHRRTVANWRRALDRANGCTTAGRLLASARMSVLREEQPASYVDPGDAHLRGLAHDERQMLGRLAAGQRAWTYEEIALLSQASNKVLARSLNRSVKAIASAKFRYGVSFPFAK
jgi:hypothetical protein